MMGRKKITPKLTYIQVEKPDQAAIDAVYDFLFDKLLSEKPSLVKYNSDDLPQRTKPLRKPLR